MTFNGATFRNNEPQEINQHQPQQPTPTLTFSDSAILDSKLDFPNQRPSFMTKTESMIAHTLLLLLIAVLSLVTKIIHTISVKYTNKNKTPKQNDPEAVNAQPNASADHAQYNASEQNVQLYTRHSRILSPLETQHQWNVYT